MTPGGTERGVAGLLDDLDEAAGPPRQNGELVFESLWESRAFGLAIALQETNLYDWEEFRRGLIAHIAAWERGKHAPEEWSYYRHWMASLEDLLVEKGAVTQQEIEARAAEIAARPKSADHEHHDHGSHDHEDDERGGA